MHALFDEYYFAYGSNMDTSRVVERGIEFDHVQGCRLPGYGLRFEKRSNQEQGRGHANIVYAPGEEVEGVLFRLVDDQQISKMDPFERAPINYSRERVVVLAEAGPIATWTYFANAAVLAYDLKPPCWYLDHLLAGREFLTRAYYEQLEKIECAG